MHPSSVRRHPCGMPTAFGRPPFRCGCSPSGPATAITCCPADWCGWCPANGCSTRPSRPARRARTPGSWPSREVPEVSLLRPPGESFVLRRGGAELPSRVADNMFWLGRYVERADTAARLMRTLVIRLADESQADTSPELVPLLRTLADEGYIPPEAVTDEAFRQHRDLSGMLVASLFDRRPVGQPLGHVELAPPHGRTSSATGCRWTAAGSSTACTRSSWARSPRTTSR